MLHDFRVYRLAVEFYQLCKRLSLPEHLRTQLLKASSSIALNIAEGAGKGSAADQKRFYGIALGSVRECEAICDLEGLRSRPEIDELLTGLGASLHKLTGRPRKRQTPSTLDPFQRPTSDVKGLKV